MERAWLFRLLLAACIALGAASAGAVCGDALLDAGESCDDGGVVDGDGCSSACRSEPRDAYKCYRAKGAAFAAPPTVLLGDTYGPTSVDVVKPATLCTPVDRSGTGISDERTSLLCYKIRRGSFTPQTVSQTDALATNSLGLTSRRLLCVSARHVGDDYAETQLIAGYNPESAGMTTIGNDLLVAGGASAVVSRIDASGTVVQTYVPPLGASFSFGFAIAVRGNDVVIGDPGGDGGNGAAYVFAGDTGALLLTLANPTPEAGDVFGHSVTAVGNDILVGDPFDDEPGFRAGAVYLFDGVTGALLHTTINPDPRQVADFFGDLDPDLAFGFRLATIGSHALVVAWDMLGGDNGVSAVYEIDPATGTVVFKYLGHLNRIKAGPSDPGIIFDDRFGWGLAVSGANDKILVGAERADVRNVSQAGAAYLYDAMSHVATLFVPDPQPVSNHRFGNVVAFAGSNLLIGDVPRTRLYAPDGLLLRTFPVGCFECPVLGWGNRIAIASGGNVHVYRDTCPDGALDPGEECDDANSDAGDGCAPDCRLEPTHHVACYAATRPAFTPLAVSLADRFETKTAQARWPSSACAPASIEGGGTRDAAAFLTCYDIKDDAGQAKFAKQPVLVRDQFGEHSLGLKKARTLCVPATQP